MKGIAAFFIDETVYGSTLIPNLTAETPKRQEYDYAGTAQKLSGGVSKTFRAAGMNKFSAEDWGGAENAVSIFALYRVSPTVQALNARMIVQADTNTYKLVLYTTDIFGADDVVGTGSTVFNFDHGASNQHNILTTSGDGEVELWVDDVLEITITTVLKVTGLQLFATNHATANKLRVGPMFIAHYDTLADRKNAPLATEIFVDSHTSPQFNEFQKTTPNFANVDDWKNYGATDEANKDAAAGDDFSTKRQSYLTPTYTIQNDYQALSVVAWMHTTAESKTADCFVLIADNGSLSEESNFFLVGIGYREVRGVFNVGPDGDPLDQNAFDTLELGVRADQGFDAVVVELAALHAEVLDFPDNPPPAGARRRTIVQVI